MSRFRNNSTMDHLEKNTTSGLGIQCQKISYTKYVKGDCVIFLGQTKIKIKMWQIPSISYFGGGNEVVHCENFSFKKQ